MNANEKRTFNNLKQKIYSATKEYYETGGVRLTLQDRLLIDYFAGEYTEKLMEALKDVESKD